MCEGRLSFLSCQPAPAADHLQGQTYPHDTNKQERANNQPRGVPNTFRVFDGCVMVLSATLGVWPYTAIMEKMGKMWILACCQVSRPVTVSVW